MRKSYVLSKYSLLLDVWGQHDISADSVALRHVFSATDAENENVAKPQAGGKANISQAYEH